MNDLIKPGEVAVTMITGSSQKRYRIMDLKKFQYGWSIQPYDTKVSLPGQTGWAWVQL